MGGKENTSAEQHRRDGIQLPLKGWHPALPEIAVL